MQALVRLGTLPGPGSIVFFRVLLEVYTIQNHPLWIMRHPSHSRKYTLHVNRFFDILFGL